jgi:hypothetical protein
VKFRSSAYWVWGSLGLVVGIGLFAKLAVPLVFFFWHPADAKRPAATSPRPRDSPSSALPQTASESPVIAPIRPIIATPAPAPAKPEPVWLAVPPGAIATQPLKLDVGALPYESAMLTIMRAPVPDSVKAQALFDLLPQVPEESMANTAEQAATWLRDRDYARIARPWIVNARTHGAVLGALFADLMQRPDAVALPTLVEIAKTPDHPFAPSAHDNLALLLGHDHGADWPAWDKAVLQKLKAPAPEP